MLKKFFLNFFITVVVDNFNLQLNKEFYLVRFMKVLEPGKYILFQEILLHGF